MHNYVYNTLFIMLNNSMVIYFVDQKLLNLKYMNLCRRQLSVHETTLLINVKRVIIIRFFVYVQIFLLYMIPCSYIPCRTKIITFDVFFKLYSLCQINKHACMNILCYIFILRNRNN